MRRIGFRWGILIFQFVILNLSGLLDEIGFPGDFSYIGSDIREALKSLNVPVWVALGPLAQGLDLDFGFWGGHFLQVFYCTGSLA